MADAFDASIERSIHEAEQLIAALEEIRSGKRDMAKAKAILAKLMKAVHEASEALHPEIELPPHPWLSRVTLYKAARILEKARKKGKSP